MSAGISDFAELMRTVLVMSAAGSIAALILFMLKPFIRSSVPKSFQYYMWLAVVIALIMPLSRIVVLPELSVSSGQRVSLTPVYDAVQRNFYTVEEELDMLAALPREPSKQEVENAQGRFSAAATVFSILWPLGMLAFLGCNVLSYLFFARKIKKSAIPANAYESGLLRHMARESRVPRLYRHSPAPTPMLIGIFRPVILLPDRAYTASQLQNILLHELTHWRRQDLAIKWISIFAGAVHWFNPFIYLVRREINRACELACDEAVIKSLDTEGKQHYGDTLIHAAADAKLPKAVLSATLCEEKKALKERLGAIMKYRRFSVRRIALSCVLVTAVFSGAFALGASSSGPAEAAVPGSEITDRPVITLYGYNQRVDNGDPHDVKKHFTHILSPDAETGWTVLTDEIFIDVQIPDGTVSLRTYYAGAGSEATEHIMADYWYSDPYRSSGASAVNPAGHTWRVADYYPGGFHGHIWAVTTDAEGAEHYSDIINVCDTKVAADSVTAPRVPFGSQYIEALENGHHTGDLDPENVLAEYVVKKYPDKEDMYGGFELRADGDRKKVYVHPGENIEIQVVAYDVEASYGDVIRVWTVRQ